ncbi:MAG TPA: RsmD family RNA methyltransferase [Phycisphaerae bacterium]
MTRAGQKIKPVTLRIIAGKWRSRLIQAPAPPVTRPMPDRVKAALFNSLGSRFGTPGELPPLAVADLFCGGGTLGLEAVSRGAARCVFFEHDPEALRIIRSNLQLLEGGADLVIVPGDTYELAVRPKQARGPFDLLLLDPPYTDSQDRSTESPLVTLMRRLGGPKLSNPEAVLMLHHRRGTSYASIPVGVWQLDDERHYGSTLISFFSKSAPRAD